MKPDLTKCELEVLHVMWNEKRPLMRGEIIHLSGENKSWKDNSIHILLNSLLRKGMIIADGFGKATKGIGRTYRPLISKEEYYAGIIGSEERLDLAELVALLLKQNPNANTLQRIQEVLDVLKQQ